MTRSKDIPTGCLYKATIITFPLLYCRVVNVIRIRTLYNMATIMTQLLHSHSMCNNIDNSISCQSGTDDVIINSYVAMGYTMYNYTCTYAHWAIYCDGYCL